MSRSADTQSTLEVVRPGRSQAAPQLPALTVLAHADSSRVGEVAVLEAKTELSRLTPTFSAPEGGERHGLLDRCLSRKPVRVELGPAGVTIDPTGTSITVVIDGVACRGPTLVELDRVAEGAVLCLSERVTLLLHRVPMVRPRSRDDYGLVGASPAIEQLRRDLAKVADLDVPVLIRGESGVGKELVARALHGDSLRSDGAYVTVNMAAVPTTLAASELFGHERGAFSGADKRREGCFGRADGGTLFLDEVGDTPSDVQPLLLRALESGEIQPVGAASPRTVDVRLLAATDLDLEASVGRGEFRLPLLQRLAGFQLRVPALRERREDIGRLLLHFVREELTELGQLDRIAPQVDPPFIPAPLVAELALYDWPGNVRQLRNVVRQLVIAGRDAEEMGSGRELHELLPDAGAMSGVHVAASRAVSLVAQAPTPAPTPRRSYRKAADVGEEELLAALRDQGYRLGPTAEALNISRTRLYGLVEASSRIRKAADLSLVEIQDAMKRADGNLEAAAGHLEVSAHALKIRMNALGI